MSTGAGTARLVTLAVWGDPGDGQDVVYAGTDDGRVFRWQVARPSADYEDWRGRTHHIPARPGEWVALAPVPGTAAAIAGVEREQ